MSLGVGALLATCCSAGAEIVVEAGPNYVLGDYSDSGTLLLQKRWHGKYSVGIGYISRQCIDNKRIHIECEWDIPGQIMIGGERRFSWKRWSFGIGLYYVDGKHRVSSTHLNARSSLEFAVSEHIALKVSHLSNGGTGSTMTVCNSNQWCVTDKFNMGMNTLSIVWQF